MMHKKRLYFTLALGLVLAASMLMSSCGLFKGPLGSEGNPIIWAFVPSGEMERVAAGADAVADLIFEETGLYIDTFVATEYVGVVEAMCSSPPQAHMASLATFAYLLASVQECAEAELVSVRYGSPSYNGQIFVRTDSGITDISELGGATFCRADELSTSSWIIPSVDLAAAGVDLDGLTIVDTGSHEGNVIGVHRGDCVAGASYVDARSRVEDEFPDVMEAITIIQVSVDIPNDGVQYIPSVSRELRDQINAALLAMTETDEGLEALDTAYQWSALEEHDHNFYVPFLELLDAAGMSPEDLME
jgi:phosphonate transport system substrate-binding protein